MRTIDLNADVGEFFGAARAWDDEALIPLVSSVHIACGFHAGDPGTMRETVIRAAAAGVAVGAHPSYPDLVGFGRRAMTIPLARVVDDVIYQIGALDALARLEGARVRSVKPHGALYNRLSVDEECAGALASAVRAYDGGLRLVLAAGSRGLSAAKEVGVHAVAEAFCDRGYLADGSLAPRSGAAGHLLDPEAVARRAVTLALDGVVETVDGSELPLMPSTLCLHGDTPGASLLASAVRRALGGAGVRIAPPDEW